METTVDFKTGWTLCQKIFHILNEASTDLQAEPFLKEEFNVACQFAKIHQLQDVVQRLVVLKIEKIVRDTVVPEFLRYFKQPRVDRGWKQFPDAVTDLYNNWKQLNEIVMRLELFRQATNIVQVPCNEKTICDWLKLIVKSTMLAQLDFDYKATVIEFYQTALKLADWDETQDRSSQCDTCTKECDCLDLFQETNRILRELDLLESLAGQTLTDLSYSYIHNRIQKTCKDNYESFIQLLEKWLQSVVLVWLRNVYCFDDSASSLRLIETFERSLTNFLYSSYVKIRIDQLFNIVIEYPESLPALEDIRVCLPRTDLKPLLTKKLQKAMETRLLHPGVSTNDILTAYVATIKSLRVLDPSGLLLETVTYPIHQYLRGRDDTVRCVVSSLTEEGPNDLAEELNRGEPAEENPFYDDEDDNWERWTPDPIDAVPRKNAPKEPESNRRSADIISMLVNIYGSKELFVNEYRTLLADRLLSQAMCDTEKEIRYLELLKLRFGESHLHFCEVMLKDIVDSKRLNQRIKEDTEYRDIEGLPLSAMIVSQQFWPALKEEKLDLHPSIVDRMKHFTAGFETLKGSRTLCWKNHLGVVNIDVELNNRTVNLTVTPVHATILLHFQDKSSWHLDELSKVMDCPPTVLRRKIGFWLSYGILAEISPDVFSVQEQEATSKTNSQDDFFVEEFESESAMASAQDQKEEELQNIWSYIMGMLLNLDSLSLERIHHMLKMFAFQGPTVECSQSELKVFLDRKVRERQLVFTNGLYTLPK